MFIHFTLLRHNCHKSLSFHNRVEVRNYFTNRSYCSFGPKSSKYIKKRLKNCRPYKKLCGKKKKKIVRTAHFILLIREPNQFFYIEKKIVRSYSFFLKNPRTRRLIILLRCSKQNLRMAIVCPSVRPCPFLLRAISQKPLDRLFSYSGLCFYMMW